MSISRRSFLSGLAAGTAGGLMSAEAHGAATKHFAGHPGRLGLLHDTTLCVGCRSCEVACQEVNQQAGDAVEDRTRTKVEDAPHNSGAAPAIFAERRRTNPTRYTVVNRYQPEGADGKPVFRKHQCMHCNEPCCASVCLVRAFSKTPEGPVLYNPDVCMGCRYCVMACPYYALSYEYDDPVSPRVTRCTMCYPRLKEGKNPGCADACPTGAILFGERQQLLAVARDRIRRRPEQYIDHIFGEHELGGTSWLTLAGTSFGDLGLPTGLTHTPLPEIGTSFLSVVPLVVTIYPGLLAGFYAFNKRKERLSRAEAKAAVVEALLKADEETKTKLAAAAKRATKDKERAIAAAVKKALAEVEKQEQKQ